MNATLIKSNTLLKKYLADNQIIGVFVDKDIYSGVYKVYEATSATSGFSIGDYFKTKKAAHIKALEWSNWTKLPVLDGRKKNPVKKKKHFSKVAKKKPKVRRTKKKLLNKYYLGVVQGNIYYWINDTRFNTSRKNAAVYSSAETAIKKAKDLGKVLNRFIGVYRSK